MAVMDPQSLLLVGDGPVAEAIVPMAELLGWSTTVAATLDEATAALPSAQAVVVTSHDSDVDAPAIAAAIAAARAGASTSESWLVTTTAWASGSAAVASSRVAATVVLHPRSSAIGTSASTTGPCPTRRSEGESMTVTVVVVGAPQ